jgi:cyclic pyranopterin phosphate synthase
MGMVDVSDKSVIKRVAEAEGKIALDKGTIDKIKNGLIKKGDPLSVAEIAAMIAAKQTHLFIPHCHQIELDYVNVEFNFLNDFTMEVRCLVGARARTGVEMEALVGVTTALNTIWDMVKYLEKDKDGQYPNTKITDIKIAKKIKG